MTRFEAVLRGGRDRARHEPASTPPACASSALRGEYGAYRVALPRRTAGRVRIFAARRQKANPRGGPTLAIQLPAFKRGTRRLAVTLVPSGSGGLVADPENTAIPPYALP